jgi:hypothetical protein
LIPLKFFFGAPEILTCVPPRGSRKATHVGEEARLTCLTFQFRKNEFEYLIL